MKINKISIETRLVISLNTFLLEEKQQNLCCSHLKSKPKLESVSKKNKKLLTIKNIYL